MISPKLKISRTMGPLLAVMAVLGVFLPKISPIYPGTTFKGLILAMALYAIPWAYLAGLAIHTRLQMRDIDPDQIERLESLPKHIKVTTRDGRTQLLSWGLFDLVDLRARWQQLGGEKMVEQKLAYLSSGGTIAVKNSTEQQASLWVYVVMGVLLGQLSFWLVLLPMTLYYFYWKSTRDRVIVTELRSDGCTTSTGEFVPWSELHPVLFHGMRFAVGRRGARPIVVADSLNGEAWLLARVIARLTGFQRCLVPPRILRNSYFMEHSRFVLSDQDAPIYTYNRETRKVERQA